MEVFGTVVLPLLVTVILADALRAIMPWWLAFIVGLIAFLASQVLIARWQKAQDRAMDPRG